jgi:hypothetical protein
MLIATPILNGWNADRRVLLGGNELLFALTAISYLLHLKSLKNSNPHFFVRMVFSGLIVKMLACMIAAGAYGWLSTSINKAAILGCFILYVLYTFLEVKALIKFLKKTPNNA